MTVTDLVRLATTDSPDQYFHVNEAQTILRMGKTALYQELRSGRLASVKRGRSRLIPAAAIAAYQTLLKTETTEAGW
jgi:hypothetical protein